MKRTARWLVTFLAIMTMATGVAGAASSPTVATGAATGVTNTSATLEGVVNPDGNQTGYGFQFGPTTAYGLTTASHAAGHGTKGVAIKLVVGGLIPGTIYHYRVAALNSAGAAVGADRVFKTTGSPPASVVTGPTVAVGKYQAIPTGSVNPEGAKTTWMIQYGLTPFYGLETFPLPLAAVNVPLPVSAALLGLAPGTLFHFRVVATNGSVASYGADATFFTYPAFRRTPRMSVRTTPPRVTHKPYDFTTSGSLSGANFVPASLRCTGQLTVRFYNGSRQVAFVLTQVQPDCTFSTPVSFRHLIAGGRTPLRVAVQFRGNGYLTAANGSGHVTLG